MKHNHNADVNLNVEIPYADLEALIDRTAENASEIIDKVTDSVVKIVVVVTVAQVVKSILTR